MNNLQKWFVDKFENFLTNYLNTLDIVEPLLSSIKYSILNGGKRLRPYLMFLGNFSLTNDKEKSFNNVIYNAIGLELIHSYSLVHDDLPCMDNDVLRRGKPTTHVKYGQGLATLAGDGMLNLGFEIMLNNAKNNNYYEAIRYISNKTGVFGMIGGQCMDIEQNKSNYNLKDFIRMNKLKTSCLFKAALCSGAILETMNKEILHKFENFSEEIGMIFQIVDDILDVESTTQALGKSVHKDRDSGKITYIDYVGIEQAKIDCINYANDAKKSIEELNISNKNYFYEIVDLFLTRKM